MSFSDNLKWVRKIGRVAVLPTHRIQDLIKEALAGEDVNSVVDMGAGTMFWTDWFIEEYQPRVMAVDNYYKYESPILSHEQNKYVDVWDDYFDCISKEGKVDVIWACDVIHHLDENFRDRFIQSSANSARMIIIKDIDASFKFGNFMNRMHDKVINHEDVVDVDPIEIADFFRKKEFHVSVLDIHKLWYPHFLLIAKRE